ncbi:MAG: hypothetical protein R3C28_03570 [Pirellulaceae bacterium]
MGKGKRLPITRFPRKKSSCAGGTGGLGSVVSWFDDSRPEWKVKSAMGQIRQNTIRRKAQRERKRLGIDGAKKGYFETSAETALCERNSLEERVRACQEILQYLQHPSSRRIGKEKWDSYKAALDAVFDIVFQRRRQTKHWHVMK